MSGPDLVHTWQSVEHDLEFGVDEENAYLYAGGRWIFAGADRTTSAEIARLARRVRELEAALEFYADEDTWHKPADASDVLIDFEDGNSQDWTFYNYDDDPRAKARAALAGEAGDEGCDPNATGRRAK